MPQVEDEYLLPSRVSTYLERNDVPSDIDMIYISRTLRSIHRSIEKLDKDEEDLLKSLETLRKRRVVMVQTQSKLRVVVSPLRRFPAEILSQIFHHAVEDGYSAVNISDGPWPLSYVSRHWRATAVTYSALWSNIYIGIFENKIYQRKDPLSLLRTCLRRSQGHDLSVHIITTQVSPIIKGKLIESEVFEMVQVLVKDCKRWKSVEIENDSLEIHDLLEQVRGRVPNLTNVVIHSAPYDTQPITAFELAPKLRTVKIGGSVGVVLGPGNPCLISYEDDRTTQLIHPDSYFNIFRSCSQHLERITCLHFFPSDISRPSEPPVFLPQLKYVRSSNEHLHRSVIAPNLESFHLDSSRTIRLGSLLHLHDLFIRSQCVGLSELTMSMVPITRHLLDIIPLIPELRVLRCRFPYLREHVEDDVLLTLFQQMTDIDELGKHKVVPHLRDLSFVVVPPHLINNPVLRPLIFKPVLFFDGSFVDMICSRAGTLMRVEVEGSSIPSDNWSPMQVSVFEGLREDGMEILLTGLIWGSSL